MEAAVARLRALPGEIDVRVCGFPEAALVPIDLDLSAIGDPRFIVYESIERMFAVIDDYDWFLNIEDDIFVHHDLVAKSAAFAAASEINEVWLPNRMEERAAGILSCVDLEAQPGWTGLERRFWGETLGVAHNHHSGLIAMSREQMRYASTRVSLKRRDEFHGGPMASAYANVHAPFLLWRAKSEPLAHHVIHADNWLFSEEARSIKQSEVESSDGASAAPPVDVRDVDLAPDAHAELASKRSKMTAPGDEGRRPTERLAGIATGHEFLALQRLADSASAQVRRRVALAAHAHTPFRIGGGRALAGAARRVRSAIARTASRHGRGSRLRPQLVSRRLSGRGGGWH